MNRRQWFMLMVVIVLGLAGCQLANPEAGEESSIKKDRLIGVYITYEPVIKDETKIGEVTVDAKGEIRIEREEELERIYAKPVEDLFKKREEEKDFKPEFEGLEGVGRYQLVIPAENGQAERIIVTGDDVFTEAHVIRLKSEDKIEQKIKMTMYRDERGQGYPIYVNPVYQTADNKIYLQAGQALTGDMAETIKYKESGVTKIEGKQKEEISEVELLVKIGNADKEITIIQMDKVNKVLETKRFSAEELSEEFWPNPKAEYLIVSSAKEKKTEQQLVSKETKEFSYLIPADKGNLIKKSVQVRW